MKAGSVAVLVLLFLSKTLLAHPHSKIEQQALISVGLDRAVLAIRIMPSYDEGTTIFATIDGNGDGIVSDDEAETFGQQVLGGMALYVDGQMHSFGKVAVNIPEARLVRSGQGMIQVKATASFVRLGGTRHKMQLRISYEHLSHNWYIQPFFYSNLLKEYVSRAIERSPDGRHVEIAFSRR